LVPPVSKPGQSLVFPLSIGSGRRDSERDDQPDTGQLWRHLTKKDGHTLLQEDVCS
jgi:hypothetical protein